MALRKYCDFHGCGKDITDSAEWAYINCQGYMVDCEGFEHLCKEHWFVVRAVIKGV